jgi:twitching motility protein PilT
VAALEILIPDYAVRNLIRQRKLEQIYSVMQTGTTRGMQTMEQALCDLVLRGTITSDVAIESSSYPDQLLALMERSGAGQNGQSTSTASSGLRLAGS